MTLDMASTRCRPRDRPPTARAVRGLFGYGPGRVVINNMTDDPQAPWGGFKYSGIGREYGRYRKSRRFLEPVLSLK